MDTPVEDWSREYCGYAWEWGDGPWHSAQIHREVETLGGVTPVSFIYVVRLANKFRPGEYEKDPAYIGQTTCLFTRFYRRPGGHAITAVWWNEGWTMQIEPVDEADNPVALERLLIETFAPKYNRAHNTGAFYIGEWDDLRDLLARHMHWEWAMSG